MAQTDAGVIEAAVSARAAPGVRRRAGRVRLGWAVFAVTSVACAVAVVLDLHTGAYESPAYVCIAEALAVMGVLLTTRMPQQGEREEAAVRLLL